MPFAFTLPTTSTFSFSSCLSSDSHPSLPLSASTYRGVVRNGLKRHKRLTSNEQSSNLMNIQSNIENYVPYLLAIDAGLGSQQVAAEEIDVVLKASPMLEWRPTLSDTTLPGRETSRLKLNSLEYEIYFTLATLAYISTLQARTCLHPLYTTASASPTPEARTSAITAATKHLLLAASIHDYLATRSETLSSPSPCIDISPSTFKALNSLALAEATLLAVLKDDPYPAAVAQDRNRNDREWMIKAPEIPKVRAHLFARLCLAAAEHAANALSLLNASASKGRGQIDGVLQRYVEDLMKTARAKACRFLGIDAELGAKTGDGIAWMQAGLYELGMQSKEETGKKGGLSIERLKKEWIEKREDKKILKDTTWGADAGRLEEARVAETLLEKWNKENDTINTQLVPSFKSLLSQMPSGREIHSPKPWTPPELDAQILGRMRAPPDRSDDYDIQSSGDEEPMDPIGAFPGTKHDYETGTSKIYF